MENYSRLMSDEVPEKSQENILEAIELEVDNARFCGCAARKTEDESEATVFKRLKKIEAEHTEALAEIINVLEEEIPESEECFRDALENYQEAHEREERAIKTYGQFASEAERQEVEEIFKSLVDIEKDHLDLSERKGAS